jgi:type II secretory pathway component PulC
MRHGPLTVPTPLVYGAEAVLATVLFTVQTAGAAQAGPATAHSPGEEVVAIGLVWAGSGRGAAILSAGGRTRVVATGETAFGGRVLGVGPGSVRWERDGRAVDLRLGAGPAAPDPSLVRDHAAPRAEPAGLILFRADVEKRLAQETPRILAETSLAPHFVAGQVTGFALTTVPAGSLLSEAGLAPGDVILRVNGIPIDNIATLVGLYGRLQGASVVQADLLRNGEPLTLTITLK